MKRRVIHFIRKKSQLGSSFIRNQIISHVGFEPHIICHSVGADKDYNYSEELYSKIPLFFIDCQDSWWDELIFRFFKRLTSRKVDILKQYIDDIKPDIMHFHYGTDAGIYLRALRIYKTPKVVSFYGYDAYSFPKIYFGFGKFYLKRLVYKYATVFLAMSSQMRGDLIQIGCPVERLIIHYHGVPSNLAFINRNYSSNKTIHCLMLSNLSPKKGHLFVLKAFRRLKLEGYKDLKLRIVGSGECEKDIKKFIISADLVQMVEIVGPVQYLSKEYNNEFQKADIFLHPSVIARADREGIPGSLVEAMFAGLPIISTYHGGIPSVITDLETGILIKEWDINGLQNAIEILCMNDELRQKYGQAAREYALKNLTLAAKQVELENIYNRLLV